MNTLNNSTNWSNATYGTAFSLFYIWMINNYLAVSGNIPSEMAVNIQEQAMPMFIFLIFFLVGYHFTAKKEIAVYGKTA